MKSEHLQLFVTLATFSFRNNVRIDAICIFLHQEAVKFASDGLGWGGVDEFNVGLEKWVLPLIPEDDPETCHHNFDPPRREWLPRFDSPKGTI